MPHIAYMLLAAASCCATCSDRIPVVVAATHRRHTGELLLLSLPDTSCKQLAAASCGPTCCLCNVLPIAAPRTQRRDAAYSPLSNGDSSFFGFPRVGNAIVSEVLPCQRLVILVALCHLTLAPRGRLRSRERTNVSPKQFSHTFQDGHQINDEGSVISEQ